MMDDKNENFWILFFLTGFFMSFLDLMNVEHWTFFGLCYGFAMYGVYAAARNDIITRLKDIL